MSQSPLASFDPFAAHPFTNMKNASIPIPPAPSQYPQPIPSSHAATHAPTQPSSLPSSQTPSPLALAAPRPKHAAPHAALASTSTPKTSNKGIFETFKPERRATPDLEDLLAKKKGVQTWGKK
ncbi:hypothetical protein EWM64_g4712 [Hericium alpestre]|uniref:Uncharacterized protein n=1 Tax=Hericium alpestre TaxID=135208 RepID=A0A4Z0A0T0_9AGAM|nr:hypothetical protein EWM64_g4712 [Hericium alpestre]